ncbi:MAG: CBS domain-containing protein [Gammaproteobacteria bacterium]|nr:CBS domain-containing protein [Gammaproteobacteria bacterium]MCW9057968.1 CBS domain-containing protein [Gammaproteobacteria bacterium]
MKVRDIMTRQLESIAHDSTIRDTAQKMRDQDVGMLPVEQNGEIIGAVTDRDITIRATSTGADPNKTKVDDAMSTEVLSCIEDDDLQQAADIMEKHQIRRLMVQDNSGDFTGIISLADLALHHKEKLEVEVLEQVSQPSTQSATAH